MISCWAPEGVGEVREGDDLVALVVGAVPDLADGDVVVLTSKILSKAEGRTSTRPREDVIADETVREVARRGPVRIVENHLGLVMAAGGVDASNVEPGTVLLLPRDPDASARSVREGLLARTGRNVAVIVTDTAGRAWRLGQTDLAIGAAGLLPLDDHAGRTDGYGNPLAVTAPAVVDEIAAAAELVAGKTSGRPLSVVRGLAQRVLAAGDHGPGARMLVRPASEDMFGLGAREAVVAAVARRQSTSFGRRASAGELAEVLADLGLEAGSPLAAVVAHAYGWEGSVDFARPGARQKETRGQAEER
ncbi:coenzyme F420-0:L-glutamate ligase [Nocardioides mangrovicus]|uniref:Coenzyme F420-0:L-glutamate ligase n=1 Tax=Nocardioides mangrovicus TaxID=2478913 RepID=A0A3L8P4K1_9ACTN|nr:coenzyme F420-0:L-glutamate ligase [Nocardioides mangrovicus]RLV49907.1 coenzyme F420-0:L-glutamate ligase [Nocardioides mangrovicus]